MKTKTTAPSVVSNLTPTPATVVPGGWTLGLDLGDRAHHVCVLDAAGQIVREGALPNTRPALAKLLAEFPRATVALEAGTHSPWISRYLTGLGAKVIVANPRRLHAISRPERITGRRDGSRPGPAPAPRSTRGNAPAPASHPAAATPAPFAPAAGPAAAGGRRVRAA